MSKKKVIKPIALAVGAALASSFAIGGVANADSIDNPFEMSTLTAGYMLGEGEGSCGGDAEKEGEGSCGEGSCGGDGEEKEGEGSCGGDAAEVHDDDPGARRFDLLQVVRRQDHRVLLAEVRDQRPHFDDLVRIETGSRLIEDQQIRFVDHRLGESHSLLVALRQLEDVLADDAREAAQLDHSADGTA